MTLMTDRPRRSTSLDNPLHVWKVFVVWRLRRKGLSVSVLARNFGVDRQTIYNWLDQAPDALELLREEAAADPELGFDLLGIPDPRGAA